MVRTSYPGCVGSIVQASSRRALYMFVFQPASHHETPTLVASGEQEGVTVRRSHPRLSRETHGGAVQAAVVGGNPRDDTVADCCHQCTRLRCADALSSQPPPKTASAHQPHYYSPIPSPLSSSCPSEGVDAVCARLSRLRGQEDDGQMKQSPIACFPRTSCRRGVSLGQAATNPGPGLKPGSAPPLSGNRRAGKRRGKPGRRWVANGSRGRGRRCDYQHKACSLAAAVARGM